MWTLSREYCKNQARQAICLVSPNFRSQPTKSPRNNPPYPLHSLKFRLCLNFACKFHFFIAKTNFVRLPYPLSFKFSQFQLSCRSKHTSCVCFIHFIALNSGFCLNLTCNFTFFHSKKNGFRPFKPLRKGGGFNGRKPNPQIP